MMNEWRKLAPFNSSEISDALDGLGIDGAVLGMKPLDGGHQLIGPVFTVLYESYEVKPEEFNNASNYLESVPEHSVLLIDNRARVDCSVWGEILSHAALKNKLLGTAVYGAIRDGERIKRLDYPVFSRAEVMRSGKNRVKMKATQQTLTLGSVVVHPGDILFGDNQGVLFIPRKRVNEVLAYATNIKANETKIIRAVAAGMGLSEARTRFAYGHPWLSKDES